MLCRVVSCHCRVRCPRYRVRVDTNESFEITNSYPPSSLLLVAPIIKQEKKEKRVLFACYPSSVLFLATPIEKADVGSMPRVSLGKGRRRNLASKITFIQTVFTPVLSCSFSASVWDCYFVSNKFCQFLEYGGFTCTKLALKSIDM